MYINVSLQVTTDSDCVDICDMVECWDDDQEMIAPLTQSDAERISSTEISNEGETASWLSEVIENYQTINQPAMHAEQTYISELLQVDFETYVIKKIKVVTVCFPVFVSVGLICTAISLCSLALCSLTLRAC